MGKISVCLIRFASLSFKFPRLKSTDAVMVRGAPGAFVGSA
jgi:hypothetical protein